MINPPPKKDVIKIGIYPSESKTNEYIENTIASLSVLGHVSGIPDLNKRSVSLRKEFRKYDILIINWIENKAISKKQKIKLTGLIKTAMYLIYFKILSKKTVYIRHNNHPHNISTAHLNFSKRLIDIIEKTCDISITHSGHNETKSRIYIPHPLYANSTPQVRKQEDTAKSYYCVFGRVQRYKKIRELVKTYNISTELKIAGPCNDVDLCDEICLVARGKSVNFSPGYLTPEDARNFVENSSGLVLAHGDTDMIVSGSYFYAASLGVPTYAIKTPFFIWLNERLKIPGLYLSDNLADLVKNLEHSEKHIESRNKIYMSAKLHFGEAARMEGWSRLLTALSNGKAQKHE